MQKIKKDPLITVIMNCYNGEKYLEKSLQSVIRQTYTNWELVFWDNCSSDNSKKIITKYKLKDKRIKYFRSKFFSKLYHARNLAIERAKGDYISFLDTDDWWNKNIMKKQVLLLRRHKDIKLIYTKYYTYNQKKKNLYINLNSKLSSGFITKSLLKNYALGIIAVLIDKNIFKKNKFNKKYNIIGDFDFFMNLSLKYPFYPIHTPLAYYRWHDSNYSKIQSSEYISELKYWIKTNSKKFNKKNLNLIHQQLRLKKLQIKSFFNYFKYLGV